MNRPRPVQDRHRRPRRCPGVGVRLADDGEIEVRGINVFKEYWNNPEATAEAFDDGWFRTGDLGSFDDDGFLTITGRKKEIIVTAGGKNVSPAALEDPIRANPIVSQVVVVGDQKPFIAALVTLDTGDAADLAGEQRRGQGHVARRGGGERRPSAPRSSARSTRANARVSRAEGIRKFVDPRRPSSPRPAAT